MKYYCKQTEYCRMMPGIQLMFYSRLRCFKLPVSVLLFSLSCCVCCELSSAVEIQPDLSSLFQYIFYRHDGYCEHCIQQTSCVWSLRIVE